MGTLLFFIRDFFYYISIPDTGTKPKGERERVFNRKLSIFVVFKTVCNRTLFPINWLVPLRRNSK